MRFVFRADASTQIGFGHVSRTVALAETAQRAGVDVRFVASRPSDAVRAYIERSTLSVSVIDADVGTSMDAEATANVAGPDAILVVDGYDFPSSYFESCRGDGRRVVYIDDYAREVLPCDFVINPNVSGREEQYVAYDHAELLVGPQYAIVHERFLRARSERAAVERARSVERLLVTMGGSDPPGATLAVVASIHELDTTKLAVRVIVGAGNARGDEIRRVAAACRRHAIEVRVGVEDMAAEMLWADVAVTASGVTATELACVGVPGVTFPIVDNQDAIAAELGRRGMFAALARGSAGSVSMLAAVREVVANSELRDGMVEAQRRTIDGEGKRRILDRLLALRSAERHTRAADGGKRV